MNTLDRRLIHYSKKPLTDVRTVEQTEDRRSGIGKPLGLWVSCEGDDDWPSWCKSEKFGAPFDHATEIKLWRTAPVLHISDATQLRIFNERFSRPDRSHSLDRIDWGKVAQAYHGVIISPYLYDCRLDHDVFWYYTWDCASGCIWNAKAIKELTPLQSPLDNGVAPYYIV